MIDLKLTSDVDGFEQGQEKIFFSNQVHYFNIKEKN